MDIPKALSDLGWTLPQATKPVGAYLPAVISGNLLFVSGPIADVRRQVARRRQNSFAGDA